MIRRIAVGIVLLVVIILVGCEDSTTTITTTAVSFQSLEGTWLFPDQAGYTEISAFVAPDDATTGMADIGFYDSRQALIRNLNTPNSFIVIELVISIISSNPLQD